MQIAMHSSAVTNCRPLLPAAFRRNRSRALSALCLAGLFLFATVPGSATAQKNKKKHAQPAPPPVVHPAVLRVSDSRVAPLPSTAKALTYHAPYDAGDCSICHQNNDVQNPGPIKGEVNDLCLSCHDNLKETLALKNVHPAVQMGCTSCHNPHNSMQPHLLLEDSGTLCLGCHEEIKKLAMDSPVKHDALTQGDKCMNCHNPHGSQVEHLLVQLPMQLCMKCHGSDDVTDHNGKKLTNMAKLLAENSHQHAPVAAQDCSACHMPHGSTNFRLLTNAYPAKFYSAYDAQNYALCFGCHDEKAFTTPETVELTQFRNGSKNLHYVHVNRSTMGRTCRACHEVHAAPQEHQIRDGVPFGSKDWILKLNYTKTATGGSCSKTCHQTRSYNNTLTKTAAPASPAAAAPSPAPAAGAAPTPAPSASATPAPSAATVTSHDAKP